MLEYLTHYMRPKIIIALLFGCANGIPLGLIVSALGAWLKIAGISKTTIGLFSLVGIPYTLKFIWSPIIDHFSIPLLSQKFGHRRSWLIVIQIVLSYSIIRLSLFNPIVDTYSIAIWALIVSFFTATQETITDSYRVEMLKGNEQAIGATSASLGYNMGITLSGGGTLLIVDVLYKNFQICEDFSNWKIAYAIFAVLIFVASIASLTLGEERIDCKKEVNSGDNIFQLISDVISKCFVSPFYDFTKHEQWALVLVFILLYRTCDSFISPMTNPFLLDIGFSLTEIALVVKTFGFFATGMGGILGGMLICRVGIIKSLIISGFAQMLSNIMFIIQVKVGKNITLLYFSIAAENIGGAMAISVFTAYVAQLCSSKYTATQYSSLMALSAVNYFFVAAPSGWVAENFGWVKLFGISVVLGIPPLIILHFLKNNAKA